MARLWRLITADPDGTPRVELTKAQRPRLTFRLNQPPTCDLTIDAEDAQASTLTDLATDLLAYRDGTLMMRGRLMPTDEEGGEDSATMTATFAGYEALLDQRIIWPTSTLAWTATDVGAIVLDLIGDSQALTNGDLGITAGTGTSTGITVDHAVEAGANLGQVVRDLLADQGVDWQIGADLGLDLWAGGRGSTVAFPLHWPSTVAKYRRQAGTGYANAGRWSGADAVAAVTREATGLATDPAGRWEVQEGDTDLDTTARLNARADRRIEELAEVVPAWTVTPRPGLWSPSRLWLGDTATLAIRRGRASAASSTVRVVEVAIEVGDDGAEVVTIGLGTPRARVAKVLAGLTGDVTKLARR